LGCKCRAGAANAAYWDFRDGAGRAAGRAAGLGAGLGTQDVVSAAKPAMDIAGRETTMTGFAALKQSCEIGTDVHDMNERP
jgi:hypothetical protein